MGAVARDRRRGVGGGGGGSVSGGSGGACPRSPVTAYGERWW